MGRTNQGGSILSYIIIGVVLALLLIGGVYFIRQQTLSGGRDDQPSQTANEPQPAAEPTPTPQQSSGETSSPQQQSTSPAGQEPSVTELPQTGPVETFMTITALSSLTWAATAYARSRRYAASL